MNKTTIFAIAICLALVYAHAAVITVPVTKDAQVTFQSRACAPDTCPNVGADQTIVVGNFQITSIGLFGFNFAASIPAGSTINSASLQLPGGYSPTGSNPITVSAYELDSNTWGEYTVVWSNRPTYSTLVGTTVFTMPNAPAPIDVTASVQSALTSADGSLGFAVTAESPYNIFFTARESTTGTAASLTIDYTAPSTPVTCGSGACGGSDLCCGSVCYNPATHSCTANDRLCPVGFDSCGTACYNPSQYVCYGTVLCPSGHLQCGGTCYRPAMYRCCSGVLSPAGSSC